MLLLYCNWITCCRYVVTKLFKHHRCHVITTLFKQVRLQGKVRKQAEEGDGKEARTSDVQAGACPRLVMLTKVVLVRRLLHLFASFIS